MNKDEQRLNTTNQQAMTASSRRVSRKTVTRRTTKRPGKSQKQQQRQQEEKKLQQSDFCVLRFHIQFQSASLLVTHFVSESTAPVVGYKSVRLSVVHQLRCRRFLSRSILDPENASSIDWSINPSMCLTIVRSSGLLVVYLANH